MSAGQPIIGPSLQGRDVHDPHRRRWSLPSRARRCIAAEVSRRALAAALAVLFVLAGTARCRRGRGEERRGEGLSVLLITVDTLRADALGAYGQAGGPTPWMD